MGQNLERPCPSCSARLLLEAPLITCAACDRDFSVDVQRAGGDPYRELTLVTLCPAACPPPPDAGVRDLGTRWRIARGPAPRLGPEGRMSLGLLAILPPLLVPMGLATPVVLVQLVAVVMFVGWVGFCVGLVLWAAVTLLARTRFEEVWVEEGVLGWRRGYLGVGLEALTVAGDVAGVHLHQGHVRVRFGSGATWHVGASQLPAEAGMAWLARRLRNATRPA